MVFWATFLVIWGKLAPWPESLNQILERLVICAWRKWLHLKWTSWFVHLYSLVEEEIASFPGSLEREINTCGEPGIFSHAIKIGPEFSEQKGNVLSVIQPALGSTLGVYDIRPPIVIYM